MTKLSLLYEKLSLDRLSKKIIIINEYVYKNYFEGIFVTRLDI